MGDDDGLPPIQIGHQRVQFRVAQILAIAVGCQFDAIGPQYFQGIFRLFQGPVHIRKGECGAEKEPPRMEGFQCGGFFIESSADGGRFNPVTEIRLGRRHGEDCGPDPGFIHESEVIPDAPGRDREPLVHLHSMGFHNFHIGVRNHMTVHICLGHRYACRESHDQYRGCDRFHRSFPIAAKLGIIPGRHETVLRIVLPVLPIPLPARPIALSRG